MSDKGNSIPGKKISLRYEKVEPEGIEVEGRKEVSGVVK